MIPGQDEKVKLYGVCFDSSKLWANNANCFSGLIAHWVSLHRIVIYYLKMFLNVPGDWSQSMFIWTLVVLQSCELWNMST